MLEYYMCTYIIILANTSIVIYVYMHSSVDKKKQYMTHTFSLIFLFVCNHIYYAFLYVIIYIILNHARAQLCEIKVCRLICW